WALTTRRLFLPLGAFSEHISLNSETPRHTSSPQTIARSAQDGSAAWRASDSALNQSRFRPDTAQMFHGRISLQTCFSALANLSTHGLQGPPVWFGLCAAGGTP